MIPSGSKRGAVHPCIQLTASHYYLVQTLTIEAVTGSVTNNLLIVLQDVVQWFNLWFVSWFGVGCLIFHAIERTFVVLAELEAAIPRFAVTQNAQKRLKCLKTPLSPITASMKVGYFIVAGLFILVLYYIQ